jgi:hypothetical protein
MDDIFISYASEDRERARTLALALEARGWSVWWDREIPLGRSYDEVIEQALADARCMLVLWSTAAVASEWVRSEASEGKRRNILVPVFIEDVDAPLAFRLLNGARLEHWETDQPHAEFERLSQRVGELLAVPPGVGVSRAPATPAPGAVVAEPPRTGSSARYRVPWTPARMAGAAAALLALLLIGGTLWFTLRSQPPSHPASLPTPPVASKPAAPVPEAEVEVAATTPLPNNELSDLAAALKPMTGLSGTGNLALQAFKIPALGLSLVYVGSEQSRATGGTLPAGAVVSEISDGAAQQAGMQALDVITAIDGIALRNDRDLRRLIGGMGPGKHKLRILRNGVGLTLALNCPACVPKPATHTNPAQAKSPSPARPPAPVALAPVVTPLPVVTPPVVTPPPVAAKPARPTLSYAALGLPISRSFWSGETRASYTRRIHTSLQQAGQEVLRMDTRGLELGQAEFDAWWNESGQHPRSRELCAAPHAPLALLAARVETPTTISSVESAYWPELKLRLFICADQRIYRQQKTLSPQNEDAWPFSTELNSEIERFLRTYRGDLTE